MVKVCSKCQESKEISEYPPNKNCRGGINTVCKACISTYGKWYRSTRNVQARLYGLTQHDYNQLVKLADSKCQICFQKTTKLCIDHDHKTSWVRGLLCDACNLGLGRFKENVQVMRNAINYLETFS